MAKSSAVRQDDYYPFGLITNAYSRENSTRYDYLYNNKELQDELALDWLDYSLRQYNPAIGRFTSVDPAAYVMRRFSVYSYAFDNPIRFIDPDGMIPVDQVREKDMHSGRTEPPMKSWRDRDTAFEGMKSEGKFGNTGGQDQSAIHFFNPTRITTCTTCPSGSEYDVFRNASHSFGYDEASGIVYNDPGLSPTSGELLGSRIPILGDATNYVVRMREQNISNFNYYGITLFSTGGAGQGPKRHGRALGGLDVSGADLPFLLQFDLQFLADYLNFGKPFREFDVFNPDTTLYQHDPKRYQDFIGNNIGRPYYESNGYTIRKSTRDTLKTEAFRTYE